MKVKLQQIMQNQQVTFRRPQKIIIQAIIRGEKHVVAVMPTGGGKSLLFMLPAFCGEGGLTIVSKTRAERGEQPVRWEDIY